MKEQEKKDNIIEGEVKASSALPGLIFKALNRFFSWIIFGVILVILIFGYLFVVKPVYDQLYKSQQVNLVELENEIAGLEESKASSLQFIGRTVEFNNKEKELMALALPNKFDLPSLMVQLEALASRRGFWVESVSVDEQKKSNKTSSERLHKVNISMSIVGGDYRSFKNFLKSMEDSIMIFDILTIDFGLLDGDSFKYDLNFVTYYYVDEI